MVTSDHAGTGHLATERSVDRKATEVRTGVFNLWGFSLIFNLLASTFPFCY